MERLVGQLLLELALGRHVTDGDDDAPDRRVAPTVDEDRFGLTPAPVGVQDPAVQPDRSRPVGRPQLVEGCAQPRPRRGVERQAAPVEHLSGS